MKKRRRRKKKQKKKQCLWLCKKKNVSSLWKKSSPHGKSNGPSLILSNIWTFSLERLDNEITNLPVQYADYIFRKRKKPKIKPPKNQAFEFKIKIRPRRVLFRDSVACPRQHILEQIQQYLDTVKHVVDLSFDMLQQTSCACICK